ncbi:MAG TPA: conjugal transfer protein TraF, partial [Armatimonadota bacterium]|nr:conjugal transfer protein TraF [Armatimonadota bacterium]
DGLAILEVPVSYARRLPIPVGTLAVGVSAKAMRGMTYRADVQIDTESGEIEDQLENNDRTSTTVGVDIGALYIPPVARNLRVGLVGKNLNSPKFERVNATDIEVSPMWRAGVAMDVGRQVSFAADLDLTKNDRFDGTESQFIGGGINYHPNGSLSFRLGAMKNLANSDDGVIGTLGIGLGLKALQLDLAVQAATKSGAYDGRSIPRYARANLALVSRW